MSAKAAGGGSERLTLAHKPSATQVPDNVHSGTGATILPSPCTTEATVWPF